MCVLELDAEHNVTFTVAMSANVYWVKLILTESTSILQFK